MCIRQHSAFLLVDRLPGFGQARLNALGDLFSMHCDFLGSVCPDAYLLAAHTQHGDRYVVAYVDAFACFTSQNQHCPFPCVSWFTSRCALSPRCSSDAVHLIAAGGAGRIACRVIHTVLGFTIEQPPRLFLSLAGFRACLLTGRR